MGETESTLIGKTLGGYEIRGLLGTGGMGAVYVARQLSLDREVALKVLAPHLASNAAFVERFHREARSIAKLNHPNILQVYDVGNDQGHYFIAMELIRGETLTAKLQHRGYLEWRECADYILQAARGLASAAKANIIHRDVKPDNLMITEENVVKVSDFGLAKEMTSTELTHVGDLMGTPAYMSPEQCDGLPLDTRSDIYSLGGTFYRAVTGVLPFQASSPVAIMYKHKHEPLTPPSRYMPVLPPLVDVIIGKMMAKRREERYATMEEVIAAIEELLESKPPAPKGARPFVDQPTQILSRESTPPPFSDLPFDKALPPSDELPGITLSCEPSLPPLEPLSEAKGEKERGPFGDGDTEGSLVTRLVEEGDRWFREGRPLAAGECWKRALQIQPQSQAIAKRLADAEKEITRAAMALGEKLLAEDRIHVLRSDLAQQLAVDPDNLEAREKLAALEILESQKRQTLLEIRKLLSAGRHEEAIALWDTLSEGLRDKTLAGTIENLRTRILPSKRLADEAEKAMKEGRIEEAIEIWEKAFALDATNDRIRTGLHDAKLLQNRRNQALREGYEFQVQEEHERAIAAFETVLSISPGHAQALKYLRDSMRALALAAEAKHDFDLAFTRWRALAERFPEDHEAQEGWQRVRSRLEAIQAEEEEAKRSMVQGNYGRAIRHWKKVLTLRPDSPTAQRGWAEARKARFYRRIIPGIALLVLAACAVGLALFVRFRDLVQEGDAAFLKAEETSQLGEYDRAIAFWSRVAKIPLLERWQGGGLARKILHARAKRLLAEANLFYSTGALSALRDHEKEFQQFLQAHPEALDEHERLRALFEIRWRIAHLLAMEKRYSEAHTAYQAAIAAATQARAVLPPAQDSIRQAIQYYITAQEVLVRRGSEPEKKERDAVALLEKAVALWPQIDTANTQLAQLRERRDRYLLNLTEANKLVAIARSQAQAGAYEVAMTTFERAATLAKEVLTIQEDWEARKILAEVAWRREAGPDMVFFLFPDPKDPESERSFQAFALDRYEWPNRAGEMPTPMSFREAIETLAKVGKVLPTREEWLFAAEGGGKAKRLFAWGNEYSAEYANLGNLHLGPRRSGSYPKGATPEGLFEMTGNLAEWVVDPPRKDESMALALGGHFASPPESAKNTRSERYDAALRHPQVGFRGAKRWLLKREREGTR